MTSTRVFPQRDPGSLTWIKAVGVGVLTTLVLGMVSCQGDGRSEQVSDEAALNTATIRVISGNGRLAGGEEYEIAEWRTGAEAKDERTGEGQGEGYFADFRGQDGGPTIDLSVKGLSKPGEFACGEAMTASLELRVDVNNAYHAVPEAPCRIEVKKIEGGVMEGYYTATLRHTGNPTDEMTVAGHFRATVPSASEADDIKAAKGPKIGNFR